jgi:diguanylate cyclase (GGDEF)-like protein/PAS domain S-box-containing protein
VNPQLTQQSSPGKDELLRRFVILFLPISLIGIILSMAFYFIDSKSRRATLMKQESFNISQTERVVQNDIRSIISDLMVLANHQHTHEFLASRQEDPREVLSQEFLSFAEHKNIYDQVRFIDMTGKEIIRINNDEGQPEIVDPKKLQNKRERYYFKDAYHLKVGEVYISPFDLNIEKGGIEQPIKPIIRLATPVFRHNGTKAGLLVLNFSGQEIINDIQYMARASLAAPMLLNRDGYWLHGPDPGKDWAFMFDGKKEDTFSNKYPEAWDIISEEDTGQFINDDGLFTFTTINPLTEGLKSHTGAPIAFAQGQKRLRSHDYYWKLITFVPDDMLQRITHPFLFPHVLVNIILAMMAGFACWLVAHSNSRRQQTEMVLKDNEEMFRTMADFTYDWEYWLGTDGEFIYTSPSCKRITGYPPKKFYAEPDTYLNIIHPNDRDMMRRHLEEELPSHQAHQMDFRLITAYGEEKWIMHSCQLVHDAEGNPLGRRASNRDITQRKMAEQHLKEIATHDTLTKLPNRNLLLDRLIQILARSKRNKRKAAVLFIDLDRFKEVNDTLGHEAGDKVLIETAQRITGHLREEDTVARMGGDEFVIILQDIDDINDAEIVAEKIINSLGDPISIDETEDQRCTIGASIGISIFPEDGTDAGTMISKADTAMYEAKNSGKNQYAISSCPL